VSPDKIVGGTAVSYLGVPLLDPRGEVMGHLSVLDTKAMPADPCLISLFEIFAARAAAEQRRLRQEMEVRVRGSHTRDVCTVELNG
jgi:hypothetical protein